MKPLILAAALVLAAAPAWAQDAASHAEHHPEAKPAAPQTAPDAKMGMMEHCKMMQAQKDGKKMDCMAMHEKMHGKMQGTMQKSDTPAH